MLHERINPDGIVIETSGAALPFDTQLNLWREPVCHWVGDDMAVVVVNAEQLAEGRNLDGLFEDQVSSADLLVLNKADLVSAATLSTVTAQLHDYAPDTPIVTVVQGQLAPEVLFPPEFAEARAQRRAQPPTPPPHHHDDFVVQELDVEEGIAPEVLIARLRRLGVLRAKGFVQTAEGLRLVQGVGRRLELTTVDTPPAAVLLGKVVVIGRRDSVFERLRSSSCRTKET
jgi:cobalamin biosynthesis protein CobW